MALKLSAATQRFFFSQNLAKYQNVTPLSHSCSSTVRELHSEAVRPLPGQTSRLVQARLSSRFFRCRLSSSSMGSQETADEGGAGVAADEVDVNKLQETVADLQAKYDDILDRYRRSIAENDNMRKRLTKQIDDAKIFGIQSFCKDLLDVADVLRKAVTTGDQTVNSGSPVSDNLLEGLRLTENQLLQVFRRHGLEQIDPLNQKFDPNKHEALFTIPNPDVEANTVLDVQKVGYQLHGRTIRPALVGVSKK